MSKELFSKTDIENILFDALSERVGERLKGWNSPLNTVIDSVVDGKTEELRGIVSRALDLVVKNKTFEKQIQEEFTRKVAKSLVGKLEGAVEKAVDKIRQDETLRARMILAIEKIIK